MGCTALPTRKARTTNSTASSFTAKIPTTTQPVHSEANGIYDLKDSGLGFGMDGRVPERILLMPYGTADSNDVFNLRLWGWSKTPLGGASTIWIPQLLTTLACTLSSTDWSAALGTSAKPADTITVTNGNADEKTLGVTISSPTGELPAFALVHLNGNEMIEFDFDLDTNADTMNCLWRPLSCA